VYGFQSRSEGEVVAFVQSSNLIWYTFLGSSSGGIVSVPFSIPSAFPWRLPDARRFQSMGLFETLCQETVQVVNIDVAGRFQVPPIETLSDM